MLEKIREGTQSFAAKAILVVVILSFAFTGVSSYLGGSSEPSVATVNGVDIYKAQLDQAEQMEQARQKERLGENLYKNLESSEAYLASIRQGALEQLIAKNLLDQAVGEMGLTVSNEQITSVIKQEPYFQENGEFKNDIFSAYLTRSGHTLDTFYAGIRSDMTRQQLIRVLTSSEFILPNEAEFVAKLNEQQRDIRYTKVEARDFLDDVTITDEEAQAYYDAHQLQYQRPERISLQYLELNAESMIEDIDVTEDEVRKYYDENVDSYTSAEQRHAAHILINASETDAEKKAQEIYTKLENGADFTELAKTDSQDTGTSANGGDLGWYKAGVMEKSFDDALFSLEKGAYSSVIETSFGFHIIKLLDVKPSKLTPFEKAKPSITFKLKRAGAIKKFHSLKEKLTDTSYMAQDTLSESAEAIGGTIKETVLFSRDRAPAPLDYINVINEAFSEDVLAGYNSKVVELAEDNSVVVFRIKDHELAGPLPFEDAKSDIEKELKQQKANEAARNKAQEYMVALKEGKSDVITLEEKKDITRQTASVDSSIVTKAFTMGLAEDGISIDTVKLSTGYGIVVLDKITPAETVKEEDLSSVKEQLINQYGEAGYQGLIKLLKENADISYNKEKEES